MFSKRKDKGQEFERPSFNMALKWSTKEYKMALHGYDEEHV